MSATSSVLDHQLPDCRCASGIRDLASCTLANSPGLSHFEPSQAQEYGVILRFAIPTGCSAPHGRVTSNSFSGRWIRDLFPAHYALMSRASSHSVAFAVSRNAAPASRSLSNWPFDELTLTNGAKFQGLILTEGPDGIRVPARCRGCPAGPQSRSRASSQGRDREGQAALGGRPRRAEGEARGTRPERRGRAEADGVARTGRERRVAGQAGHARSGTSPTTSPSSRPDRRNSPAARRCGSNRSTPRSPGSCRRR